MKKRVVVTGLGLTTPLADGITENWESLINSECGIVKLDGEVIEKLPVRIAAKIKMGKGKKDFDVDKYFDPKELKYISDFILYGLSSATQAVEDSGIITSNIDLERVAVCYGSGVGGLNLQEDNSIALHNLGYRKVSPRFIPSSLINLTAAHIAMKYKFTGQSTAVVTACATGAHSIISAANTIKLGEADAVVVGSSEAAICPLGISGFASMRALSTNNDNPSQSSRPWDKKRDGFVMGEGGATLILEDYEHAKNRNAKIYAELIGYGATSDAYHVAAPDPSGTQTLRAMSLAVKSAGIQPEEISYINAHATSTPLGDEAEMLAIQKLLGNNIKNVAISSTKGAIGHLLGAAGSVEAIFSILALNNGIAPPTLNLEEPDDQFKDINLVPKVAQERKMKYVCSNSFGFGGTNSALIFANV